jgi:uncharacterized protein involved in exopolysaccharide biosynthesis
MNFYFKIAWNAFLTSTVVTLVSGLFILGMPQVYRATATVPGSAEGSLIVTSAELLNDVIGSTKFDPAQLGSWQEDWLDRKTTDIVLLQQSLNVSRDPTGWINISIEAQDSHLAAELANAIAESYIDRVRQLAITPEVKLALSEEIESAEAALADFQNAHPILRNPVTTQQKIDRRESDNATRLANLENELALIDQNLSLLQSGDIEPVARDQGVHRALQQRDRQLLTRAQLTTRYGAEHKKMIAAEAEVQTAERLLQEEVRLATHRLREKRQSVEAQVAAAREEAVSIVDSRAELNLLVSEFELLEIAREAAIRRYESGGVQDDTYHYSAAVPPDNSLGISQAQMLLMVFVLTFIFVSVLMTLRPLDETDE